MTGPQDQAGEQAQIGILLVHGIGEQKPGQTLIAMGEPIIAWLEEWLHGMQRRWIAAGVEPSTIATWLEKLGCKDQITDEEYDAALQLVEAKEEARLALFAHGFGVSSLDCLKARELTWYVWEAERHRQRKRAWSPVDLDAIAEREALPFLAARARVSRASLKDSNEQPAYSRMQLETLELSGRVEREDWLFAEAHWAQEFVPPTAHRVGLWTAFVSPYMLTTLFVTHLELAAAAVRGKRSDLARSSGIIKLLLLAIGFCLLAPLSLLVQLFLVVITALNAIPLDAVRRRVRRIQWAISSLIGDPYVFLGSASNRAAIAARVRSRLEWLAQRCKHLVVIAHSEGAAVLVETMHDLLPKQTRLLVTLGSGLDRMNALQALHTERGWGLRAAIVVAILCCYTATAGVLELFKDDVRWWFVIASFLGLLVYTIGFIVYGSEVQGGLHPGWWGLLRARGIRWLDYFTAYDPVVYRGGWAAAGAQEVSNLDSVLRDHAAYSSNPDQVIASVTHAIARAGESHVRIDRLTKYDAYALEFAARWRPHRIAFLKAGWWLLTFSWLAVALRRWPDLDAVGTAAQSLVRRVGVTADLHFLDWALAPSAAIVGVSLILLAWLVSCALIYVLWLLWNRRDGVWLMHRRTIYAADWRVFLMHFFAYFYLAGLAAVLLLTSCLYFAIPWNRWWIGAFGIVSGLLTYDLAKVQQTLWNRILKRRQRSLMTVEEAATLAGTTAHEVRRVCPTANQPFDALAYDDAMYESEALVDRADALVLKEKMARLHAESERIWKAYRAPRTPDRF
jgi:hypothetical protein